TLTADGVASAHPDPVEKKPLYHYLPGSRTFSIGTMGCNFHCHFCQNAGLSRHPALTGEVCAESVAPEQIIRAACESGCSSVAFTYNEPTVFYELLLPVADCAHQAGLRTLLISNGFQSKACLEGLHRRINAANIDLKACTDSFYRTLCGARLAPVLDNLKRMRDMGWWLEITTLIIPGHNDTPDELHKIARFIREELGAATPWHVSAFHPCHEMQDRPPTPVRTLLTACEIGTAEGLLFVYPGNIALEYTRDTLCPVCGSVVIHRRGWDIEPTDGTCASCNAILPGVWA
ncbi:MAG: AmmeMemoRadiSam system radical SAM enzyme, partial [Bilophila sp.]